MHEPHLRAMAHCHRVGLWATPRAGPYICVDPLCLPRLFPRQHRRGVTAIVQWVAHVEPADLTSASVADPVQEHVLSYEGSHGPWPTRGEDSSWRLVGPLEKRKLPCHPNTETPVLHKQVQWSTANCSSLPVRFGMRSPTTRYFPLLSKRTSMGIAAMMSSIDRPLVPVPALAPPRDNFAAIENFLQNRPKGLKGIGAQIFDTIDLDVCLQDDARFGGQCQYNERHRHRLSGWGLICHTVDMSLRQDENTGAHARIHTISCL